MHGKRAKALLSLAALLVGSSVACGSEKAECTTVGAIDARYVEIGGSAGPLGECTRAESDLDGGRAQEFRNGSMYWTPQTGAWEVYGQIGDKYAEMGGPTSALRWPTSGELATPNNLARFNRFETGNIYSSPAGTYAIHGAIFDAWGREGFEASRFGFPTSDEFAVPDGRQSDFQGGWIKFITGTGQIVTS
ncbi:MAG: trehalose corynomycolyl transferase [Nocardiaceae bacterium]|nr:trehalose corynomycolyl transferase [Nocardiaceae bacterium]